MYRISFTFSDTRLRHLALWTFDDHDGGNGRGPLRAKLRRRFPATVSGRADKLRAGSDICESRTWRRRTVRSDAHGCDSGAVRYGIARNGRADGRPQQGGCVLGTVGAVRPDSALRRAA